MAYGLEASMIESAFGLMKIALHNDRLPEEEKFLDAEERVEIWEAVFDTLVAVDASRWGKR